MSRLNKTKSAYHFHVLVHFMLPIEYNYFRNKSELISTSQQRILSCFDSYYTQHVEINIVQPIEL